MTNREALDRLISEKDWAATVIDMAQKLNWRVAHFRAARTGRKYIGKDGKEREAWTTPVQADGAGFPDLLMIRGERVIVAELKSYAGQVEPRQQEWLDAFEGNTGIESYVWQPQDADLVERTLR